MDVSLSDVFLMVSAALAAGAVKGYCRLRSYQGTGVNKAPLSLHFERQAGSFLPFTVLKHPRALDLALQEGEVRKVKNLLGQGADPHLVTHFSGPALCDALGWECGFLDMLELFLDREIDVNQPNMAGATVLHRLVYARNQDMAAEAFGILLEAGADLDLPNCHGDTVRDLIASTDNGRLQAVVERYDRRFVSEAPIQELAAQ